ncbi:MAG: hypothetical protein U1E73_12825 [Planctomycetota bacterium]
MTEPEKRPEPCRVFCRRLERTLPVDEHAECPYCFGKAKEIATGQHEQFCDFRPGKDPIQFGFPPDSSRNLE